MYVFLNFFFCKIGVLVINELKELDVCLIVIDIILDNLGLYWFFNRFLSWYILWLFFLLGVYYVNSLLFFEKNVNIKMCVDFFLFYMI